MLQELIGGRKLLQLARPSPRPFSSAVELVELKQAFCKLSQPDLYTWNTIIHVHAHNGEGEMAIHIYNTLNYNSTKPNRFTLSSILKACGNIRALEQGRIIHEQLIDYGLFSDLVVGTALLDMYARCECLQAARNIFEGLEKQDVISWSAMIAAYARHGYGFNALQCFENMLHSCIQPSKVTFLSLLKACTSICSLEQGRRIHEQLFKRRFQYDIVVGSTLVDMYAKCESTEEARDVFDRLSDQDIVAWNAIISGYAQHGEGCAALECVQNLQNQGLKIDRVTYLSIMKACSVICATAMCRHTHEQVIESGLQVENFVGNAIIDMYSKCASLVEAHRVFNQLPVRDVLSWDSLISGYAQIGEATLVMLCFAEMQHYGIRPDDVICTTVLMALCRVGLLEEALQHYKNMVEYHGIQPDVCHTTCIVDLLGQEGYVREAEALLKGTGKPDICQWVSLLSACNTHIDLELAKRCFDAIIQLDAHCAQAHVLMSNIYAGEQLGMKLNNG